MKPLPLKKIVDSIEGNLIKGSEDQLIEYATTRPRRMSHSTLFFDLINVSDIGFLNHCDSPAVVTTNPGRFKSLKENIPIVKVENVEQAYWKFVDFYRGLFIIPIIGITGTCGKTTTKEMLKHILSLRFNVHATHKSQNSLAMNLPYLLGINDSTEAAIFEMGVVVPDDLVNSCKHFQPQIRILLNIGVHHLNGCKTPEAYFQAKTKILEGFDPHAGTLILNADDENIQKIDVSNYQNIVYFGFGESSEFRASTPHYYNEGILFTLHHQGYQYPVFLHSFGQHNVYNALAAISAASRIGISVQEACEGLGTFVMTQEHCEFLTGAGGCTIIDDSWNNSALSMSAALQLLEDRANSKMKIALLGYMPQLGTNKYALEQYAKMGQQAVEVGVDLLVVTGEEAREIGLQAINLGMSRDKVYFSNNGVEVYDIIRPFLNEKSILLLKITHRQMKEPSFSELKQKLFIK